MADRVIRPCNEHLASVDKTYRTPWFDYSQYITAHEMASHLNTYGVVSFRFENGHIGLPVLQTFLQYTNLKTLYEDVNFVDFSAEEQWLLAQDGIEQVIINKLKLSKKTDGTEGRNKKDISRFAAEIPTALKYVIKNPHLITFSILQHLPFTIIQQINPNSFLYYDIVPLGYKWFSQKNDDDTEKKMMDYMFKRDGMAEYINQRQHEDLVNMILKEWAKNLSLVKLAISYGVDPCLFMKLSGPSDVMFHVLQSCIFSEK